MNIYVEHVEKDFTSLLQKEIQFIHKDKILKEGRLMLFSIKDFYLTFQLFSKELNKIVHFELPYPFKYINDHQKMALSYMEPYFTKGDIDIDNHILFYFAKTPSKLYNTEVIINKVK
jgi:hypothetical protein|tara:strand:+ start:8026 stop:8376 length:351 start_codon:yes stop_codon:yes gene_type:complete